MVSSIEPRAAAGGFPMKVARIGLSAAGYNYGEQNPPLSPLVKGGKSRSERHTKTEATLKAATDSR